MQNRPSLNHVTRTRQRRRRPSRRQSASVHVALDHFVSRPCIFVPGETADGSQSCVTSLSLLSLLPFFLPTFFSFQS
ncbi:hypothetical protein GALMADRAFT_152959 [Galerina marginata CBS 339.88]|uniref:Uncharacterized protein n=1 Tax=Galerina marginata (strain CBS 339.88) TaxID=685588 RepID=A0A067TIS0_GALM3|nr:hypothetical protein GALMADRAFT_152959 [Galerina marginata CBS 339.88]